MISLYTIYIYKHDFRSSITRETVVYFCRVFSFGVFLSENAPWITGCRSLSLSRLCTFATPLSKIACYRTYIHILRARTRETRKSLYADAPSMSRHFWKIFGKPCGTCVHAKNYACKTQEASLGWNHYYYCNVAYILSYAHNSQNMNLSVFHIKFGEYGILKRYTYSQLRAKTMKVIAKISVLVQN